MGIATDKAIAKIKAHVTCNELKGACSMWRTVCSDLPDLPSASLMGEYQQAEDLVNRAFSYMLYATCHMRF